MIDYYGPELDEMMGLSPEMYQFHLIKEQIVLLGSKIDEALAERNRLRAERDALAEACRAARNAMNQDWVYIEKDSEAMKLYEQLENALAALEGEG